MKERLYEIVRKGDGQNQKRVVSEGSSYRSTMRAGHIRYRTYQGSKGRGFSFCPVESHTSWYSLLSFLKARRLCLLHWGQRVGVGMGKVVPAIVGGLE